MESQAVSSPASTNGGKIAENRKTECAVCKEVTDNHHMHYGALCCFSCRAFFRRAHQRNKKVSYHCKGTETCDVTYKNRKKCQKCRYQQCLQVGMDPSLVLTDEQKQARFRKRIQKTNSITLTTHSKSTLKAETFAVCVLFLPK